ncbi:MAG: PHP domain-containing protein [Clostridia bacterium]|nr:PHP domain-containing protein [Clostridia bacterium]
MRKTCDLHTHSIFSDGSYTPAALIDAALQAGLGAIALTDHNTVGGLPDMMAAARGKDIDVVLGAEFSVDYEGTELHMLGLFIDPAYFSQITALMQDVNRRKEESNIALIASLRRVGIALDYDEIKGATPGGQVNRARIALAMLQKGYVRTRGEAFDGVLSKTGGHYQEPERLTVWHILDVLRSIGALPVLAHPFLNLKADRLATFLPTAKAAGLVGMECYYSTYDEEKTAVSLQLARENGLLPSGGSDFHGAAKPDISLGAGRGNLQIPYTWYEALRERAK